MTTDDKTFTPDPDKIYPCRKCGEPIAYCYSYRTRKSYQVNVKADGTANRTDFHSKTCSAAKPAAPAPIKPIAAPVTPVPAAKVPAMAGSVPAPAPVSGYPDVMADLLERSPELHAQFEQDIARNRLAIATVLELYFLLESYQKPAPAPKPVVQAPAPAPKPVVEAPKPVVQAPAPAPKPVVQAPAPAPKPGVKMGEYLCNTTGCNEVSFTLEVKPGKPNCCPSCKRVLLFKGLSAN